jgi:histidinol-phosphate aminotransferase
MNRLRPSGSILPLDRRLTRRALGRRVAAAAAGAACWPSIAAGRPTAIAPPAGEAPIRIGSNENPHGLGPAGLAAIRDGLPEANRYPFELVSRLAGSLAATYEIDRRWVTVAPGSGEILRAAALAFTSPSLHLVAAAPTFEAPGRAAETIGAKVASVPVQPSGALDLPAMAERATGAGLFFVCNPNNPTGGVSSADAVKDFVARVRRTAPDAVLLIDEAYHDYVEDPGYATAIPLTRTDPRLIVSRTFSKIHGMAGLRVGYVIGHPDTLSAMGRVLSQGSMSGISAVAAAASLGDREHLARQRALNREAKAFTRQAFEGAGYRVLPSDANFVMVDVRRDVSGFAALCREVGVFIARPFPPLRTHARVSIGTIDEMRRAVPAMLSLLAAPASAHASIAAPVWAGEC